MKFVVERPHLLLTDSNGAIGIGKFQRIHNRSKHIDVRYHFTRERIVDGTIKLEKVSTHDNPADLFTKNLSTNKLRPFMLRMMGREMAKGA